MLYVEQLIAPDVINTMPEATLRAFADHGDVAPPLDADAGATPRTSCAARRGAGIDLDAITAELEREGVRVLLRLLPPAARLHREQAPPRRARGARDQAAGRHVTVTRAEAGRRDPAG